MKRAGSIWRRELHHSISDGTATAATKSTKTYNGAIAYHRDSQAWGYSVNKLTAREAIAGLAEGALAAFVQAVLADGSVYRDCGFVKYREAVASSTQFRCDEGSRTAVPQ